MPKHRPIKFETDLDPKLKKQLIKFVREKRIAKTALNATLMIIALGGILTVGTIAPNFLRLINWFLKAKKREKYEKYHILWRNFYELKRKQDLEFVREKDNCLVYRFTKNGREKIKKLIFDEISIPIQKKWDGKWRLVLFDIPEPFKLARMALSRKLKELGFYQFQKSVYIHPFPCLEEIEFIKMIFNIKPFVKIFVVEEMNDGKVLYYFRNLIKKSL